jgi:hypothetical protein
MKIICEICGRYSENEKTCSNCGAEILEDTEVAALPLNLTWGWGIFGLDKLEGAAREQALRCLRDQWDSMEKFTLLSLVTSQLAKFDLAENEIKVLIREDDYLRFRKTLETDFGQVSTKFEPLGVFSDASDLNHLLNLELGK